MHYFVHCLVYYIVYCTKTLKKLMYLLAFKYPSRHCISCRAGVLPNKGVIMSTVNRVCRDVSQLAIQEGDPHLLKGITFKNHFGNDASILYSGLEDYGFVTMEIIDGEAYLVLSSNPEFLNDEWFENGYVMCDVCNEDGAIHYEDRDLNVCWECTQTAQEYVRPVDFVSGITHNAGWLR